MVNNLYGANEAVTLKDASTFATPIEPNITFGKGAFEEATVVAITQKADTDTKVRFVYDAEGGSGLVFAGNKLVSSKILDITTNEVAKKHFDEETGEYTDSTTEKVADKVTVKWFGTQVDKADNVEKTQVWTTEFDIVDKLTVEAMIAAAQGDLQDQLDALEEQHAEDVSTLNAKDEAQDASISAIEDFLSAPIVTAAEGSAAVVTPSEEGFKTYTVDVAVDASTVKVVEGKLAVAKYAIDKIDSDEAGYDSGFAAQYRLMMTDPETNEAVQVGDTINIMKDFLLKGAHVCNFSYKEDGTPVVWDGDGHKDSYSKNELVTEDTPIWAKLVDGTMEQAPLDMDIKLGHTYLHLILNTKPTDEVDTSVNPGATGNDQMTDVYLDFTEILGSLKAGDEFISYENGLITLNEDKVVEYVDSSLGITEHFEAIDASIADQEERLAEVEDAIEDLKVEDASLEAAIEDLKATDASLDERVSAIENSYVVSVDLTKPSEVSEQFSTITLVETANGTEETVSVDVANEAFYTALNDSLQTLSKNDEVFSGLLTWSNLD